jgi:uncharacterized protein YegJ (DUF2314 family)
LSAPLARRSLLLTSAAASAAPSLAQQPRPPRDIGTDPDVAAAVAESRRTLPTFWERLRANDAHETGYALKIVVADQHGREQLWLSQLRRRGGRLYGTIDTAPQIVRSLQTGQPLEIREDAIVDWMFFRNGKIVGNRTGLALMKFMQPSDAEKFRRLYE